MRLIDADKAKEYVDLCSCGVGGEMGEALKHLYGWTKELIDTVPTEEVEIRDCKFCANRQERTSWCIAHCDGMHSNWTPREGDEEKQKQEEICENCGNWNKDVYGDPWCAAN